MAAWRGARITVPALFVAGDRDPVILRSRAAMDGLAETVPGLRERVLLPGAGHWTQQERPAEVNDALITFLAGLPAMDLRARAPESPRTGCAGEAGARRRFIPTRSSSTRPR